MLINYRHYTTTAMLDILKRVGVCYSRGDFSDRGSLTKRDTISLRVVDNGGRTASTLEIVCEVGNNLEGCGEMLAERGFTRDRVAAKQSKFRTIPAEHSPDAGKLVETVMAGLAEAVEDMPFLLYASFSQKALADYRDFMASPVSKTSFGNVRRQLGYPDSRVQPAWAAPEAEIDYLVASCGKGQWAAWATGDLIVPLFPSEHEARAFLTKRLSRTGGRQDVRTIAAPARGHAPNLYVLVDHTARPEERRAWLRSEIERLERQGEAVYPERLIAGPTMKNASGN